MKFPVAAVLASVAGVAVARMNECATDEPVLSAEEVAQTKADMEKFFPRESYAPIRTHFHFISDSNNLGYDHKAMVKDQMEIINDAFASSNFRFVEGDVTTTKNSKWYTVSPRTSVEQDMKQSLRIGGKRDLNIYVANLGNRLNGWATFPRDLQTRQWRDGVVVRVGVMPKACTGSKPARECLSFDPSRYSSGAVTVHEIGHWLSLYHVFQGSSCGGNGDYVSDTPPQSTPSRGCPTGKDSCQGGGRDSVTNYMDYSDGPCRTNFTPGQIDRAHFEYERYRL